MWEKSVVRSCVWLGILVATCGETTPHHQAPRAKPLSTPPHRPGDLSFEPTTPIDTQRHPRAHLRGEIGAAAPFPTFYTTRKRGVKFTYHSSSTGTHPRANASTSPCAALPQRQPLAKFDEASVAFRRFASCPPEHGESQN